MTDRDGRLLSRGCWVGMALGLGVASASWAASDYGTFIGFVCGLFVGCCALAWWLTTEALIWLATKLYRSWRRA